MNMKITLASNSPRRRELLTEMGVDFTVIPSTVNERVDKPLNVYDYVKYLAKLKAENVFLNHGGVVLGADTVVYHEGEILGKAKSKEDAVKTLCRLSGKTHKVITGYAIVSSEKTIVGYNETLVTFNALSKELITEYVESGKYEGKAGSYGIQDGYNLVSKINGSYTNVVGLPVEKIKEVLTEFFNEK